MNSWQIYTINDMATLINKSWKVGDNSMPYLGLEHIGQQTLQIVGIGNSEQIVSDKKCFKKGDILFGKLRPYFRKVVVPDFDGICSTDIWVIKTKNEHLFNQDFLFFFFANQPIIDLAIKSSTGTRMPRANWDILSSTSWKIPPIDEQKRIAKCLKNIHNKISINNSIISKLEEMAKTIYEYWFLQFDFPNSEGKPYASSGGAMKYSEELGREIPSDWEVRYTNHFCEVQTGSEDANFATPQGKYKFFTCAQESYQCDTPAFEGHAILIAGNGDFNVKHYTGEFNAYQRTYVLLPKKQNYALLYFVVQQRIAHFKKGSNGSIVKFIRKSDVENIPIPYPNDTKILDTLNHFILMKEQKMSENQKLAQLRDWLLPMLMNGQVRVE